MYLLPISARVIRACGRLACWEPLATAGQAVNLVFVSVGGRGILDAVRVAVAVAVTVTVTVVAWDGGGAMAGS